MKLTGIDEHLQNTISPTRVVQELWIPTKAQLTAQRILVKLFSKNACKVKWMINLC